MRARLCMSMLIKCANAIQCGDRIINCNKRSLNYGETRVIKSLLTQVPDIEEQNLCRL